MRHRSATLFTAVNPAIPDGGFVGESKYAILRGLAGRPESVARTALLRGDLPFRARVDAARDFLSEHDLGFPVVLKPDIGQRGTGVIVARSEKAVEAYLSATEADTLIQEYVPGVEFGIFYYRFPGEERGRIFSLTDKRFPEVVGDGRRTLERLVLDDGRAVCMARAYLTAFGPRVHDIPPEGQAVPLVEIGSHCRGAAFLDGAWIRSAALEESIDRLARSFDGFHFGRFDIRARSYEHLARGVDFKVVELNGVTAEATHIYDPRTRLIDAYRVVFEQWRIAFEIGAANAARGSVVTPLGTLARTAAAHLGGKQTKRRTA
jgi:hypothetical protein